MELEEEITITRSSDWNW